MNNHPINAKIISIYPTFPSQIDSANDRNQCGCELGSRRPCWTDGEIPVVMKGLKTAGPAIRCLGQGRKGEAGGGGGGRHREVEAVRWRMDHRCTEGRGRGSGRGALENEARNEKRREVEMVMGGIRKRGGKKNCGGCCEKVGLKSFEGNGIINGCRTHCEERGGNTFFHLQNLRNERWHWKETVRF